MSEAITSARVGGSLPHRHENVPPTLFLLPGSVGYGPSLAAFASAMGKVARVVPIRYPSLKLILSGRDTVAAMAAAAIEQISRAQPSGDVRLLGHSLGGAVGFEVAARLMGLGRSIKFLGILDTSILGERSSYWATVTRTVHRIRTNRVTAHRMVCRTFAKITVAVGGEAHLARLLDRHIKGRYDANYLRTKAELQEVLRARAFFQWLPEPKPVLPIVATLFRCHRERMPRALGWEDLFQRVNVVPIAGGHYDLAMQPHLTTNLPLIEQAVVQSYCQSAFPERQRGHQHDCASPTDLSVAGARS